MYAVNYNSNRIYRISQNEAFLQMHEIKEEKNISSLYMNFKNIEICNIQKTQNHDIFFINISILIKNF